MILRFEVTETSMNVCGTWDIDEECFSFIAWSLLAYRIVIHNGGFVRGWKGVFILQNFMFACLQAMYCLSMIETAFVSSYVTPMYLWFILFWGDRLLCGMGRLKTSYICNCYALFCMGTLMRRRNCPSAINTCVLRYW